MQEGKHTTTADQVGTLFSTVATDNAEVVPPSAHHGPHDMWSTDARPPDQDDGADPEGPVDAELVDDGTAESGPAGPRRDGANGSVPGEHAGGAVPPKFRGVFTAEPVPRTQDVIEEDEARNDLDPPPFRGVAGWGAPGAAGTPSTPAGEPLFSSGRGATTAPDPWMPASGEGGRQPDPGTPFAPGSDEPFAGAGRADRHGAWQGAGEQRAADRPQGDGATAGLNGHHHVDDSGSDPNGLRAAVSRLNPLDVERAAVPIAVCGALLHEHERVLGAVTGQMLGRPAVVVVTGSRVLVINDRRWQPIVDEFALDSTLVVRGRHDQNVAALSFADPTRLSMVDGISEVSMAIELAEHIRAAGAP